MADGVSGKLHLAKRMLQKQVGIRTKFDVISTNWANVRGSHGRIPTTDATRATLLTDWPLAASGVIDMHDVKPILLEKLTESK